MYKKTKNTSKRNGTREQKENEGEWEHEKANDKQQAKKTHHDNMCGPLRLMMTVVERSTNNLRTTLMRFGLVPSAVVVMDRGAPQYPLLSEHGQNALVSNPDSVVKAFNYEHFGTMDKETWAKDVLFANDTRDIFYHKFECDMLVLKGQDVAFNDLGKTRSRFKVTTLELKSGETFQMPVESDTKVTV